MQALRLTDDVARRPRRRGRRSARRRRRRTIGDPNLRFRIASIAKPLTAWACLVAVEEGVVSLDQPVGQPGLHAAPPACPRRRVRLRRSRPDRQARAHTGSTPTPASSWPPRAVAEAAGMTFADYLARGGVRAARHDGDDAAAARPPTACRARSTTSLAFVAEMLRPRLISRRRPRDATHRTVPRARGYRSRRRPLLDRAPGDSASRSVATSSRTGPAQRTRRRRSDISAAPVPSCGWILPWGWPASP